MITVIPEKSRVEVLQVDGDWSKVVYDNKTGYVFNYFYQLMEINQMN
ncbi:SH3 domain-containing protein [Clostridioides difficile]|nr:SH3 domain-containing protein [Clostridioides difficile]